MTDPAKAGFGELNRWCVGTGGARLPAGGWLSPVRTGHWEVTEQAAERFGFSPAAVAILRDAAQDPDFYEFGNPAAHAQSPDEPGYLRQDDPRRERLIEQAQDGYVNWVLTRAKQMDEQLAAGKTRQALYFLGYGSHGVEDLAAHAGRTNPEHAAERPSPDTDPAAVELARAYAFQFLRAVLDFLGADRFDELRRWDGDGTLGKSEKEALLGHGWDFGPKAVIAYQRSAHDWTQGQGVSVRWARERVLGRLMEALAETRATRVVKKGPRAGVAERWSRERWEPLSPTSAPARKAKWTVLVYMAGDDTDPDGIEYAIRQDLMELKRAGSTGDVNLVAQTDEVHDRNCYRYRLRRGTPLPADRLAVYRGDLNTGRVKTLTDFVAWAHKAFPADRYALVLWGHGSGHDDEDVYRLARGQVSPRIAAQLARKRLGFLGSTRRALLERTGPSRGYGYDSTACDFLDDVELARALRQIRQELGQPLDVLGFDACLMSMIEVAYELRESARVMVASQLSEPGDGWCYSTALRALHERPDSDAEKLGEALVADYERQYHRKETLAAVRLAEIAPLADALQKLAGTLNEGTFLRAAPRAIDCSPERGLGYRDLGSFLAAVAAPGRPAAVALKKAVIRACGGTSGLSIYIPPDYDPEKAGSTDALYERLDFPATKGWARLLRRIYVDVGQTPRQPGARAPRVGKPAPTYGSLQALDRHNAHEVLRGFLDRRLSLWTDRLRAEVLRPLANLAREALRKIEGGNGTRDTLIAILPGIMGSQLSDRRGQNGLCWIDPVGLVTGSDFQALEMADGGSADADPSVKIEPVGLVPVVYDRLALALIAVFGPVVEQVGYDWRRAIAWNGDQVAARLRRFLDGRPQARVAIVAHSMGGLVAAHALRKLGDLSSQVVGLCALGTPWLGSFEAVLNLRGEGENVRTFDALCRLGMRELLEIAHSFWGLTDLLPGDRPSLLEPQLYAAGPLGHAAGAAAQLASPKTMNRSAFGVDEGRTFAIVSDRKDTLVNLRVAAPGQLKREMGPGDGTVPLWSATQNGKLPHAPVDGSHSTLPLDGHVISLAIGKLAGWLGAPAAHAESGRHLRVDRLPAPLSERGGDRSALLEELDHLDEAPLSLDSLLGLMPFA